MRFSATKHSGKKSRKKERNCNMTKEQELSFELKVLKNRYDNLRYVQTLHRYTVKNHTCTEQRKKHLNMQINWIRKLLKMTEEEIRNVRRLIKQRQRERNKK